MILKASLLSVPQPKGRAGSGGAFAYAGDEFADSGTPRGGDGKDRNAERLGKRGNVDSDFFFFRFVHHVQRQHDADARFDQLERQIKAAVEIGRVRNVDDDIIISAFYVSLGYLFLIPIGREGIAARQVYDIGVCLSESPHFCFFGFKRHARSVSDGLPAFRQQVEKRGFAAVRVAGERDGDFFVLSHSDISVSV